MRICFIGDSGCLGHLEDRVLGWPGRLQHLAAARGRTFTTYNLGVRGDTSVQVLCRWQAEASARLPPADPGAVVFAFGINDAARNPAGDPQVPPELTRNNVSAILSEATRSWPVLFVGPYPVSEHRQPMALSGGLSLEIRNRHVERADAQLAELCIAHGVPYLSVFHRLRSDAAWMDLMKATDGTHPCSNAYNILASAIDSWSAWRDLAG